MRESIAVLLESNAVFYRDFLAQPISCIAMPTMPILKPLMMKIHLLILYVIQNSDYSYELKTTYIDFEMVHGVTM